MEMKEFEDLINKDQSLSRLLNDKEITVFSNFSRTDYSDELKNYFQDRYYTVFKEMFQKSIEENNDAEISALIRSIEFLATEKTKELITPDCIELLNKAHENLLSFTASLSDESEMIHLSISLSHPINGAAINIINRLGNYGDINQHKEKIISAALDICDIVSGANPKRYPFKFSIYETVIKDLLTIDDLGPLSERFEMHQKKITKKRTGIEVKYWILAFILVILFLIKLLSKIDRVT